MLAFRYDAATPDFLILASLRVGGAQRSGSANKTGAGAIRTEFSLPRGGAFSYGVEHRLLPAVTVRLAHKTSTHEDRLGSWVSGLFSEMSPRVCVPQALVTRACSTWSIWLQACLRTWRTASAIAFMPYRYASPKKTPACSPEDSRRSRCARHGQSLFASRGQQKPNSLSA
jgi:hypothetical protein